MVGVTFDRNLHGVFSNLSQGVIDKLKRMSFTFMGSTKRAGWMFDYF